ncbi:MAG: transglycosylase SLT domain-containing protein [Acidimicrobiia bacterium]|nr:transglycosylase SLT domain-containing protein [Acidimicrobiia bacterium]
MQRSVALTGLIIIMSLAMVGFAAFSSTPPAADADVRGVDVPGIDATASAAVFAAPLVPLPPAPSTTTTTVPVSRSFLADLPTESTTTTSTTTTTAPPPTPTTTTTTHVHPTTTTTPPTTAVPTTAVPTTTSTPPTTAGPTTTSTTVVDPAPSSSWPPAVEQWRGLVSSYFSGIRIEEALAIIDCESRGDPNATNSTSGAAGLFQFVPATWDWVAAEAGLGTYASGAPYDPTANTAAAAWLVQRSIDTDYSRGAWGHWTCRRVLG